MTVDTTTSKLDGKVPTPPNRPHEPPTPTTNSGTVNTTRAATAAVVVVNSEQEMRDHLHKQREREARSAIYGQDDRPQSFVTVPNLSAKLSPQKRNPSINGSSAEPVRTVSLTPNNHAAVGNVMAPPLSTTSPNWKLTSQLQPQQQQPQRKLSHRDEQDRAIKQAERDRYVGIAGRTSTVVPNLASQLSPAATTGPRRTVSTGGGGHTTINIASPPLMTVASAAAATTPSPSQPVDNNDDWSQASSLPPSRTTSYVPNLAAALGDDNDPDSLLVGPGLDDPTKVNPWSGAASASASASSSASIGGDGSVRRHDSVEIPSRSSVLVPNLAAALAHEKMDIPVSPSKVGKVAATATSSMGRTVPGRASDHEFHDDDDDDDEDDDDAIKERERQYRAGRWMDGTTTTNPTSPTVSGGGMMALQKSSMMARYEAVGLVFGDDDGDMSVNEIMMQPQPVEDDSSVTTVAAAAGIMDRSYSTASGGLERHSSNFQQASSSLSSSLHQRSSHVPESEVAVRERLRAAALAMDGVLTSEDEEQQLKQREREEREYLTASLQTESGNESASMSSNRSMSVGAQGNSSGSLGNSTGQLPSDAQIKAQAKATSFVGIVSGRNLSTSHDDDAAAKDRGRGPRASSVQSSQSELDRIAKSRGRSSRGSGMAVSSGNSVVSNDTAVATSSVATASDASTARRPVQAKPGAMAVSQGQAERLVKSSLTEHPELVEMGSITLPMAFASTGAPTESVADNNDDEAVPDMEQSVADHHVNDTDSAGPTEETKDLKSMESKTAPRGNRWKWIAGILLIVGVAAGVGGGLAASQGSSSPVSTVSPTLAPTIYESERFKSAKSELANVLTPLSELENVTSPQYHALQWIADEDTISSLNDITELNTRYVLAVFYFSLNGPNWLGNYSAWLDGEANVCTWVGIGCDGDELVSSIVFDEDINITGTIPGELQHLSELGKLTIQNNRVVGFQSPIPQLQFLNLERNSVTTSALTAIFQMTNLVELIMAENELVGSLPDDISNLSDLRLFDVSSNAFTGTITSEFQPLTSLQEINLVNNHFQGQIMDLLQGQSNLTVLNISDNMFSGSITSEISNLKYLQKFQANTNTLSGTLPNELWNIATLGRVYMSFNQLTGTIGPSIGNASLLQEVLLTTNRITGTIPTEVGMLSRLLRLWLSQNSMSGTMPTDIGNMAALTLIELSNNNLSGNLPSEIGKLGKLTQLGLQGLYLSGPVPPEYQYLKALGTLNLAGNTDLTGTIPSEMCDLPLLQNIELASTDVQCNCSQCHTDV